MMKKKVLGVALSALAVAGVFSACGGSNKTSKTVITGATDTTYNGSYVYLLSVNKDKLDSVQVANGAFSFAREVVDSLSEVYLQLDRNRTIVFLEPGEVKVSLGASTTLDKVSGTPLNDAYDKISGQLVALEKKYRALQEQALADSVNAQAKQEKIFEDYSKEFTTVFEQALKEHNNDALGGYVLSYLLAAAEKPETKMAGWLSSVGEKVKNNAGVKAQLDAIAKLKATSAGSRFVDFSGVDDNNKPVKLSDYVGKGHYVLVDFWASWCGPCRKEIPNLLSIYDKYKAKGLEVVGVAVWDKMEDHLVAMKDLKITYPQIFNEKEATDLYGIKGIPEIILFAPDGTIVARGLRGEVIAQKLDEELAKSGKL